MIPNDRWRVLFLCLGLLVSAPAQGELGIRPRPLSEAERQGVALAAAYLEGGAEAWWNELASESALAALGRDAAVAEIAVRAGPRRGARWQLQTSAGVHGEGAAVFSIEFPSGVDETLRLQLVEEAGRWKVREVLSLVDPAQIRSPEVDLFGGGTSPTGSSPASGSTSWWWAALAAVLLLAAAAPRRRRRMALGAGLAMVLVAAAACQKGAPESADQELQIEIPEGLLRLAELATLREVLAGGSDAARTAPYRSTAEAGLVGEVGQLWEAQYLLIQRQLNEAQAILDRLPSPSALPLAPLLRARLGFLRSQIAAFDDYDLALRQGSDHDGLRLEVAEAYALLGEIEEADHWYLELGGMGTRLGEVYYALARLSLYLDDEERAVEYLELAWEEEPVERSELFANPLLASLAIRPELLPKLQFNSPTEPVAHAAAGERELAELRGREASLVGKLLTLAAGEGTLVVPGGAEIAPQETPRLDAGTRARHEEEEALALLSTLRASAGALAQPRRRRQIVTAAGALSRSQRWEDLATITTGLATHLEQAPPSLVQLRALALMQLDREAEATRLLIGLAQSDAANRRRDPVTFYQLAELMATFEKYDLAIRLMQKARTLSPIDFGDARERQFRMEKRLVESFERYESEHFDIRYPKATGESYPRDVALVLETERKRLLKWIPLRSSEKVEVDLFPLQEFMQSYSQGVAVLGLFDGRVRVPFADLKSLHPYLVAILSHEVAHALITEYTDDQAPKWFQEGLAQHIQMVQDNLNPIPDLMPRSRILAFPLIEDVLSGFSEAQLVDLAYNEATWVVHFIEARWGVKGIHRLLQAFAAGKDTAGALKRAFGLSEVQFERAAWDWCLKKAPDAWPVKLVRYDKELNPYVRRSRIEEAMPSQKEERAAPRVGMRRPERASRKAQMEAWYATYSARTQPIKVAIAPLVQAYRTTTRPADLKSSCRQAQDLLTRLAADPGALAAPDKNVARQLQVAYRSFLAMAQACTRGGQAQARQELDKAEQALGQAARALAPYGLRP